MFLFKGFVDVLSSENAVKMQQEKFQSINKLRTD